MDWFNVTKYGVSWTTSHLYDHYNYVSYDFVNLWDEPQPCLDNQTCRFLFKAKIQIGNMTGDQSEISAKASHHPVSPEWLNMQLKLEKNSGAASARHQHAFQTAAVALWVFALEPFYTHARKPSTTGSNRVVAGRNRSYNMEVGHNRFNGMDLGPRLQLIQWNGCRNRSNRANDSNAE